MALGWSELGFDIAAAAAAAPAADDDNFDNFDIVANSVVAAPLRSAVAVRQMPRLSPISKELGMHQVVQSIVDRFVPMVLALSWE